jgi:predicted porin
MKYKHLTAICALFLPFVTSHAYTFNGVDFHGFFDQGYMQSTGNNYFGDTKNGEGHFTELALNASKDFGDKVHVAAQMYDFREGAMGGMNIPELDWAYIDYSWQDWMGFRAGKVKAPFGLYGDALDVPMARPYIFLPQSIYTDYWTDCMTAITGAAVYGTLECPKQFGKLGSLDYNIEFGVSNIRDHSGLLLQYADYSDVNTVHYHNGYTFNSQLVWNTPMKGLKGLWSFMYCRNEQYSGLFKSDQQLEALPGGSGMGLDGEPANYRDWESAWSLGAEYEWKKWTFTAEYSRSMYRTWLTVDNQDISNGGVPSTSQGWYIGASYPITDKARLSTYYSVAIGNVYDPNGVLIQQAGGYNFMGYQKDLALSLQYKVKPWWTINVEGHFINGTLDVLYGQNQPWANEKQYWFLGAVKTIFYF